MKIFSNIRFSASFPVILGMMMMMTNLSARAFRIHCKEDTVKVSSILSKTAEHGGTFGERCVFVASQLEGTPWSAPLDNDSIGTIIVNMHGFDRLGFINTVMALADASMKNMPTIKEFVYSLEAMSRRKGIDEGFVSQLHYGADWIVDNVYRGHVKEMTEYVGGGSFKAKTLDYVSRHKDEYPALKDSVVLEKIKMIEMGYRSHRIPHLKKQSAGNKSLHELMQNGDIIMMLSPEIDYDIYDMGFVEMKNGEPYLKHISHESGIVVTDEYPLSRLFKIEGQHFYGYRWLRPTE